VTEPVAQIGIIMIPQAIHYPISGIAQHARDISVLIIGKVLLVTGDRRKVYPFPYSHLPQPLERIIPILPSQETKGVLMDIRHANVPIIKASKVAEVAHALVPADRPVIAGVVQHFIGEDVPGHPAMAVVERWIPIPPRIQRVGEPIAIEPLYPAIEGKDIVQPLYRPVP
jgi:hypothetical protein